MTSRLRPVLLLLPIALLLGLAGLAMCREDPAPQPEPRAADAPAAPDDGARPQQPTRRRVRVAQEGGGTVERAGTPEWARGWSPGGAEQTPAEPAADAPPTARVRAVMTKDGKPFRGGHICFFREAGFVPPQPWDGQSGSDAAYMGVPRYAPVIPWYDPVLGGWTKEFESVRGITDENGVVELDVPADRALVLFVRYGRDGIPLKSFPRIHAAEGEQIDVAIEAARERVLRGRCVDADGKPQTGVVLQAYAPVDERPLSWLVGAEKDGTFSLRVFGDDATVRVRAIVTAKAGIYASESQVPPMSASTEVTGVDPGGDPIEIRHPRAQLGFIELETPAKGAALGHVQVEGMSFDPAAGAWVRLGGREYRGARHPRAVIGLPREELDRPLMLWSWGWTITAVDARGRDRAKVQMTRGRPIAAKGTGWNAYDHIRVIAWCGPAGREIPCVWIDGLLGNVDEWSRDDAPPSEIEIQIVRDGRVIGRSPRIPASPTAAEPVTIDVP